jgi:hypothetical protein
VGCVFRNGVSVGGTIGRSKGDDECRARGSVRGGAINLSFSVGGGDVNGVCRVIRRAEGSTNF